MLLTCQKSWIVSCLDTTSRSRSICSVGHVDNETRSCFNRPCGSRDGFGCLMISIRTIKQLGQRPKLTSLSACVSPITFYAAMTKKSFKKCSQNILHFTTSTQSKSRPTMLKQVRRPRAVCRHIAVVILPITQTILSAAIVMDSLKNDGEAYCLRPNLLRMN